MDGWMAGWMNKRTNASNKQSVRQWQNNTDRGIPKYSEKTLPHCRTDHHQSWACNRASAARCRRYGEVKICTRRPVCETHIQRSIHTATKIGIYYTQDNKYDVIAAETEKKIQSLRKPVRKEHRQLWFRATHFLLSLISWISGRETVFVYCTKSVSNLSANTVCLHFRYVPTLRTSHNLYFVFDTAKCMRMKKHCEITNTTRVGSCPARDL
jgi:hypothetical protein